MRQEQFMSSLSHYLKPLSHVEREDILQDFKEHFINGLADGKTEKDISASLGSPEQIAKDMLANYHLEKATKTATTGNVFRAVWAAIGLSFFNLIIVLGPFIALVAIIFSGWVSGASFVVAPFLILLKFVLQPISFEIFEVFLSLTMAGLGILVLIGMYYVTKYAFKGFILYLKFNTKLIKGGSKHV